MNAEQGTRRPDEPWAATGSGKRLHGTALGDRDTASCSTTAAGRVAAWSIARRGLNERVLVVLAHPGDIVAMAGTIAVAARRGARVMVLALTCEAGGNAQVKQLTGACRALRVAELIVRCYPRGHLDTALDSLTARADLRATIDDCDPTIVLTLAPRRDAEARANAAANDHATSAQIIMDLLRDPSCAPRVRTVGQRTMSNKRIARGVAGIGRGTSLPTPTAAVAVRAHGTVALLPVGRRCTAMAWVPPWSAGKRILLQVSRMHRLFAGNEYYVLHDRSTLRP